VRSILLVSTEVIEMQVNETCVKLGQNEARNLVNKNQAKKNWNAIKAQQIIKL
jgi:hypothetical protein